MINIEQGLYSPNDIMIRTLSLNIEKAKKELDWRPRLTLKQSVKFTAEWYQSFYLKNDLEDLTHNQIEYFN